MARRASFIDQIPFESEKRFVDGQTDGRTDGRTDIGFRLGGVDLKTELVKIDRVFVFCCLFYHRKRRD